MANSRIFHVTTLDRALALLAFARLCQAPLPTFTVPRELWAHFEPFGKRSYTVRVILGGRTFIVPKCMPLFEVGADGDANPADAQAIYSPTPENLVMAENLGIATKDASCGKLPDSSNRSSSSTAAQA